MKTFTLLGFFSLFSSKNYVFDDNGESGFKLCFSKNSLDEMDSNQSSSGRGIISLILLFVLFLCSNFLSAQVIKIDGLSNSTVGEWNQTGISHTPDNFNLINQDNIFAGNEKDFFYANNWFWKLGTAKDKNDIANGAAIILQAGQVLLGDGSTAPGGPFIAFAGDRISNSGDAQIGFWFFQDGTHPETVSGVNLFTPAKHVPPVIGDILVLADFTGGGNNGAITVLEWVGTGGNYADSPAFNQISLGAGVAENNGGPTPVPSGWVFKDKNNSDNTTNTTQYGTNEFYEGYVNLAAFGGASACFSRFQLETRASQSITSVLDDFVGGALGGVPSVSVTASAVACSGGSSTVTAAVSPAGNYTFVWTVPASASNPGNVSSFSATVAGTYSVIITNQNGCSSDPGSAVVTVPTAVVLTAQGTNPLCFDGTGSVTFSATGGTGAISYTVDGLAATSPKTGLAAGSHTIVATDANGCTDTKQITITIPTAVALTATPTNPLCFGGTGSVTFSATGGTGAISYTVDGLAATSPKTGLAAGSHTIVATDANGCTDTKQITITIPTAVALTATPTNPSCFGGTGSVTFSATGGTGAISYTVDGVTATSPKTGLVAGSHTIVATDANGCTDTKQITITIPTAVALTATPTNPLCFGGSGSITFSATGGTGTIAYTVNGNSATSPFTASASGNYTIVATDANGCTDTKQITITIPTAVALTATPTNPLCFGGTGSVTFSATGGTGAKTYTVDGVAATSPKTGLAAGSHTIVATDANGCTDTKQITITIPTAVALTATPTNPLCFGGTGSVTFSATGGTGAISYTVDGLVATSPKTGLAAGSHTIVATDANGCTDTKQITITIPTAVALTATPTNPLCFGGTGSVTFSATGGTGAISYTVDGLAATSPKTGLAAGSHTIVATDANGCTDTKQITITIPTAVALTAQGTNPLCFGGTGSIMFSATGGTGSKTYTLNGNAATSPATGLAAGNYTIVATDANGCTDTKQVTIAIPTAVSLTAQGTEFCFGGTGSIIFSATGGTGTKTYTVNGNVATSPFTVSAAGVYSIEATDANGCKDTEQVTVTVNPLPTVSADAKSICAGNTVALTGSPSGGTWSGLYVSGSTFDATGLLAGSYTVTYAFTDSVTGCENSANATILVSNCNALCTYTQGYYGNTGGTSCADGVSYTTKGLIAKSLSSYPDHKMIIGKDGNSIWMTDSAADIDKIIEVLPGGGSSYALTLGANKEITALPNSYLKKGNINNTLLAQTITLGLNIGIDGNLGAFVLQSGTLATAAPQGGCGSKIPMPRSCSYDVYTPTINEYKYFDIPAFVNGKTVQDLFDMANKALAGDALPAGVTLTSLANAIDVINNAFDGCRISMGYNQTPLACIEDRAAFIVNPVPIVDYATITYKFSYVSNVTIEVRSLGGSLLSTYQDPTPSYLDKAVVLPYNFTSAGTYFIKIITNIGSSTRQVIKN